MKKTDLKLVYLGIPEHVFAVLAAGFKPLRIILTGLEEPRTWELIDLARTLGIPLAPPHVCREPEFHAWLQAAAPDVVLSMNFTGKIPAVVLEAPRWGAFNVHPSLLPRYRGANPYFWAVLNGDAETGVTLHRMTDRFDEGDIVLQARTAVTAGDCLGSVVPRLNVLGQQLAVDLLGRLAAGQEPPGQPQPPGDFPRAPLVRLEHLQIQWTASVDQVLRLRKASYPYFSMWLPVGADRLRVADLVAGGVPRIPPGTLMHNGRAFWLGVRDGAVELKKVSLNEEPPLNAADFLQAHRFPATLSLAGLHA